MSYTRIDDGILTHPKMADAEEACPVYAWVLWTKALVYVNQHKLDGRITKKIAGRLVGVGNVDVAIEALVSTGLWDEDESGYRFHDFTEHNATKDQRAEKAKKNAEAQAAHREKVREEKRLARLARVRDDAENSKQPVSAYEKGRKAPPLHSTPLLSTPLPSSPSGNDGGEEGATGNDDLDPTEEELFRSYTAGVCQASALTISHARSEENAFALSTVRGTHQPNVPKADFLIWLTAEAKAYVVDAMARQQERKYEKNYAPTKFLAWVEARKAGSDPFPLALVAPEGGVRRPGGYPRQGRPPEAPSVASQMPFFRAPRES